MPNAQYDIEQDFFRPRNTNTAQALRGGASKCKACLTPKDLDTNECRGYWTPDQTKLWVSQLNGWNGDCAMARASLGSIKGNEVPPGDPWGLTTNGPGLRFSIDEEEEGPLVVGTNLDSFSLGDMPDLPWLFEGDLVGACIDSIGISVAESTYTIIKNNGTAIPADLDDADIVALGASNSWPTFGSATIDGPVYSFSYTETFNAGVTFRFNQGQHDLLFQIGIDVGARQSVKLCRLTVTGSYPNRVGVFSLADPSGTPSDSYSLDYEWLWESVVRPQSFYNDLSTLEQTETMATDAIQSTEWTATGVRNPYVGFGSVNPTDPPDGTVTLPTFTDITWKRFFTVA